MAATNKRPLWVRTIPRIAFVILMVALVVAAFGGSYCNWFGRDPATAIGEETSGAVVVPTTTMAHGCWTMRVPYSPSTHSIGMVLKICMDPDGSYDVSRFSGDDG